MDRREAIRVIKGLLADRDNDSRYPCVSSPRHYEALDLAIEALLEPTEEVDYCNNCPYLPWGKDCISRQQAVEVVTNTIREKFSLADWYEQLVGTGLEIENLIKELPPVTPTERTGEWIPVSERLPEEYDQYLCYCEEGLFFVYWLENKPWAERTVADEGIIAWQPLPEIYRPEGENK